MLDIDSIDTRYAKSGDLNIASWTTWAPYSTPSAGGRAAIWGISERGPMAMMFAASYPQRTRALLLYGSLARFSRGEDYPHGYPPELDAAWLPSLDTTWGTGELSRAFAPSCSA